LGFAAVVMGVSIMLSVSRAGIFSFAAGLVFIAICHFLRVRRIAHQAGTLASDHRSSSKRVVDVKSRSWLNPGVRSVAIPLLLIVAIGVGTLGTGLDPLVGWVSGSSASVGQEFFASRGWIWRDTISMIRANPITGAGLGAFETAYPNYSKSDGTLLVNYAHN